MEPGLAAASGVGKAVALGREEVVVTDQAKAVESGAVSIAWAAE